MRRQANRQEVDNLFILGAGASKALTNISSHKNPFNRRSTPVDKNFLEAMSYFALKQGWQCRALELIKGHWLDSTEIIQNGLEEAVIKRVAHFDMLSALYPDKSRRKCTNEIYLNNLSHLIADYLFKCRSNSSGNTKQFINRVFPLRIPVEQYKNRIITFNYDLIVDRPLIERGLSKRKLYFDRIVSKEADGIRRSSSEIFQHPLILKLHGSINWRCSREYFDQIITGSVDPTVRIPIWTNDTKCPSPDDHESPLIIPPVPNKPITKASIFKMLWTTAFEYLHKAKRIVIIGYSCPSTDVLAQSMFTQFRNKKVKEIFIADPDSEALPKFHELMRRAVGKKARWQYYSGFDDYLC
jgi:hypothetical protein